MVTVPGLVPIVRKYPSSAATANVRVSGAAGNATKPVKTLVKRTWERLVGVVLGNIDRSSRSMSDGPAKAPARSGNAPWYDQKLIAWPKFQEWTAGSGMG